MSKFIKIPVLTNEHEEIIVVLNANQIEEVVGLDVAELSEEKLKGGVQSIINKIDPPLGKGPSLRCTLSVDEVFALLTA